MAVAVAVAIEEEYADKEEEEINVEINEKIEYFLIRILQTEQKCFPSFPRLFVKVSPFPFYFFLLNLFLACFTLFFLLLDFAQIFLSSSSDFLLLSHITGSNEYPIERVLIESSEGSRVKSGSNFLSSDHPHSGKITKRFVGGGFAIK